MLYYYLDALSETLVSTGWKNFFKYFDLGGAPFAKLSYLL